MIILSRFTVSTEHDSSLHDRLKSFPRGLNNSKYSKYLLQCIDMCLSWHMFLLLRQFSEIFKHSLNLAQLRVLQYVFTLLNRQKIIRLLFQSKREKREEVAQLLICFGMPRFPSSSRVDLVFFFTDFFLFIDTYNTVDFDQIVGINYLLFYHCLFENHYCGNN